MIKKTFYTILIILLGSIVYLNYFGVSTKKFNQNIEKKFKENYPGINLKLNEVKLLLDILKFSINLETKNTLVLSGKDKIELKKITTKYDLKSIFTKKFAIKYILIDSKKNKIKKVIKIARAYKDSPQLLIIDKLIKTGDVETFIKINFDENGKLVEDKYEFIADISDLFLELPNKQKINKISGIFKYSHSKIEINDLVSEYQDIKLHSNNIFINKKNKNYIVQGDFNTKESEIKESIVKTLFSNNNLRDIVLSSTNNFSFNVSKKFKISDIELFSDINLKKAHLYLDSVYIKKYVPNFKKEIIFLNQKIKLKYKKRISFDGSGKFQIGEKKDDVKYIVEFGKENTKFDLEFDIRNIPFKIDLLNFTKHDDEIINLNIKGENKKNNLLFDKIILKKNNDRIHFDNLILSKNFQVSNFNEIDLKYIDKNKRKNDISIIQKNNNNFLIKSRNFNLSNIIDQILFNDTNNSKLFDDKERIFKINFKKNYIDDDHYILNLSGTFNLKGNDIYDLSLSSTFPNNDNLSMSIKSKNDKKVTTFYSKQAKPFVKKYKFVKGFEGGKIDFYSVKQNNISKSQLKIFDFSLKELPALTKILTLASLQGIADILSGEGVGFDELEISFTNKKNLMEIDELYSIGPAISIMMEGYVKKNELVSLRGTLVPATTINKFVGSIPLLGDILVGKKTGEGVFGVSFKLKGPPKDIKTSVNPIKTLTPRFITRTLEKIKKSN